MADVSTDLSLVDLLDLDNMELESIDTTVASVPVSVLMKETPTQFSTQSESLTSSTPVAQPSTSTATASWTASTPKPSALTMTTSQPLVKRLRMGLGWPPQPSPSTATASTASQPPAKIHKMGLSRPHPKF